jgi:hypothetical protein
MLLGVMLTMPACESLRDRAREQLAEAPIKREAIEAGKRPVYYAAQHALKRLGFQLSRSAEAQGIIEAHTAIQPGDTTRGARQLTVSVRLETEGDARTMVGVVLREAIEGGLAVGAPGTLQPLREHALYRAFFAQLRAALAENPGGESR